MSVNLVITDPLDVMDSKNARSKNSLVVVFVFYIRKQRNIYPGGGFRTLFMAILAWNTSLKIMHIIKDETHSSN